MNNLENADQSNEQNLVEKHANQCCADQCNEKNMIEEQPVDECSEDECCEQEFSEEDVGQCDDQNEPEENSEESSIEEAGNQTTPNKKNTHRNHSEKFLADLEKIPDNESKLQFIIDFMEASIAQIGSPHFKSFWEARNLCLELFKENISPIVRAALWTKYNELSKEARRLKDVLDEQSAYAVEQIEMAITALEADIQSSSEQLEKISPIEFAIPNNLLPSQVPVYQQVQRELNLLNTLASRINGLRKELIRTEMRVRLKNKFFQRLSTAGDNVFPHRKDLIKQISDSFMADVDAFIEEHFKVGNQEDTLFSLREGIKALQGMAKVLTLNTHSFTHTRMRLSECWDYLKGEEKERKKERSQQKAIFKQNMDEAMKKLVTFKAAFEANEMTDQEANKQIDEMGQEFRNLELSRQERQQLKDEFNLARQPLLDKTQMEELARQRQENEKKEFQRNKILAIKQQIQSLLDNSKDLDAEALSAQRDTILDSITTSSASKVEKIEMERQLKPLRDLIVEKRESSLLSLSSDDYESLKQLKEVLQQRKDRRQEIKNQIDIFRKNNGNSGLDFEQALNYKTQMEAEKERLEKINQGIKEVEDKIRSRMSKIEK